MLLTQFFSWSQCNNKPLRLLNALYMILSDSLPVVLAMMTNSVQDSRPSESFMPSTLVFADAGYDTAYPAKVKVKLFVCIGEMICFRYGTRIPVNLTQ